MEQAPLTEETQIGECPVCHEPIIYHPGHHLSCWFVRQKFEGGTEVEVYYHTKCWGKKEFDSVAAQK